MHNSFPGPQPAATEPALDLLRWQARLDAYMAGQTAGDAAHDISHLRRVAATALSLARPERAKPLVVLTAAYLHDLVNVPKDHPDRSHASTLSASAAIDLLTTAFPEFPADLHAEVAHAIEAHSFSAAIAPRTIEAKVVQDADRLEAVGAIGIARVFYTAGKLGQALFDGDDPLAQARPLDDRKFAVDHFRVKLLELHRTMQTSAGRQMAQQNSLYMMHFLSKLSAELAGDMRDFDEHALEFLSKGLQP